jgi:putative methionine-R-sulfoxide reductase with GAF domain
MTERIRHLGKYPEDLLLQLEKRNDELATQRMFLQSVFEFASDLLGKTNIEEIAWLVTQKLISKCGLEDCVIYLVKDGYCHQVSAYGPKNGYRNNINDPMSIKLGEGIVGTVALTGVSEIIGDTSKDSRYIIDDKRRNSELCVPIYFESEVIGVIDSESSRYNFYTENHLHIISTVANLISIALKNALNLESERESFDTLKRKNEKFQVLMQHLHDPVIFVNDCYEIIEWSDKMVEITGKKAAEVIDQQLEGLSFKGLDIRLDKQLGLLEITGENIRLKGKRIEFESTENRYFCFLLK